MTNHPRRQRGHLAEVTRMSDAEVVQLAEVASLRRHLEVGRWQDSQAAAVRDIVSSARGAEQMES